MDRAFDDRRQDLDAGLALPPRHRRFRRRTAWGPCTFQFEQTCLRVQVRSLEHRNRELAEEMAIASHELRNLLLEIRVAARLAGTEAARLAKYDSRAAIEDACLRGQQLLARHVELDDASPGAAGPVDLARLVADEVDLHRRLLGPGAPVRLELELEPVQVGADVLSLQEAVGNLVANAIRHCPPGGTVRVHLRAGHPWATLEIEDQGKGLDPEAMRNLFRPHPRGEGRGMKLGLWIARRLVEANGGEIGALTRPGAGALFWIRLPALPREATGSRG